MLKHSKKLETIYQYLVAAILLIVPLYPKFPFIKVAGTFVSIRIEDFLLLITGLAVTPFILKNRRKFLNNKVVVAIFLFLLSGLISLIFAILITKTVVPHIGILHWIRRVEYFIPFVLGTLAIFKKSMLEFYLKVLMISMFIMFIYGFGQINFQWPMIITQNQEYSKGVALRYIAGGHINSTFAGHYDLSTFLVLVLPIFICLLWVNLSQKKYLITNLVTLVVISTGLWLLAVSGSRISVASYLFSATIALVLIRKYKAIPLVVIYSLLILSFSPSLKDRYIRLFDVTKSKIRLINHLLTEVNRPVNFAYAQNDSSIILERRAVPSPTPTPIPTFEDRSTNIRLNVEWPRAIRAWLKNPLLGTGYSSITLATDNDYLRMLGEVGILGFFSFWLIFLRLGKLFLNFWPLHKKYQGIELAFISGIIGALPGILANAVFIDVFEASKFAIVFWLLIGLCMSLINKNRYE